MKIINGKEISMQIKNEIKEKILTLKKEGVNVCLAVIQVGDNPASSTYVKNKEKACEYCGIESKIYKLDENTTEENLLKLVEKLNNDDTVNGILVQLPLPRHIDEGKVINKINPKKDVDGFHPENVGKLSIGEDCFVSCTPAGIIELLKRSNIKIAGSEVVIVGRSNIVGKPLAQLLLKENATVTIAHSKTTNLREVCKRADILIVAIGKAKFIDCQYIKKGATVIDVGINRDESNKLCGDVAFDNVVGLCGAITPVPGGVGPMTIAMLMNNCVNTVKE